MSVCTCSFSYKITTSQKRLKFIECIHSRRAIPASSDNKTSEQTSNRPKRTMISPRTVYFVCFALLFGTPPAKATDKNSTNTTTPVKRTEDTPVKRAEDTPVKGTEDTPVKRAEDTHTPVKRAEDTPVKRTEDTPVKRAEDTHTPVKRAEDTPVKRAEDTPVKRAEDTPVKRAEDTPVKRSEDTTMINDKNGAIPTSNINRQTTELNSAATTNKQPVCTQATHKPKEGHFIFFLPTDNVNLLLIVAALTVGCFALLLTTLICACQVCHLRGIISSLQHRYDNIDGHAVREKSESPRRDEGQVDGQPTETCLMLSEVTAAQEESREDEQNNTVKDSNGDTGV